MVGYHSQVLKQDGQAWHADKGRLNIGSRAQFSMIAEECKAVP
jgi:hypothetical protein